MDLTTKILDLSACYRRISAVFPYFPRLDFDFEGWYEECVRRAIAAEDEKTYHLTLMAFLNRLGDGHTDYTPPRAWLNRVGYLPFRLEAFREGYYRQGRRVLALDGVSMEEWAERMEKILPGRENFLYPGPFQAYLPLFLTGETHVLTTETGEETFTLGRERPKPDPFYPEAAWSYKTLSETPRMRRYDGNILYIRLDHFLTDWSKPIRSALTDGTNWQGVVLDIRQNIGGMTAFAAKVAELFFDGEFSGCQKWTRLSRGVDLASGSQIIGMTPEELEKLGVDEGDKRCLDTLKGRNFENYTDRFGEIGQKAVYSGPLTLLVGPNTVSAAEDFTAMFRSNKRAWLLGMPTRGTTGTPLMERLPGGGSIRVVSVGYRLLDGTEFIGRGIQPDEWSQPDPAEWFAGKDKALQLALERFGMGSDLPNRC